MTLFYKSLFANPQTCLPYIARWNTSSIKRVISGMKDDDLRGLVCNNVIPEKILKILHDMKIDRLSAVYMGLVGPRDITPQLARFLGCRPTDKKSRNDVTTAIYKYIKENELQVPERKRFILFDKTLADLLLLEEGSEYSYTQIQSHFAHLFRGSPAALQRRIYLIQRQ